MAKAWHGVENFGRDGRFHLTPDIWYGYMSLGVIFREESNGDVGLAVGHRLLCVSATKVMTRPDLV